MEETVPASPSRVKKHRRYGSAYEVYQIFILDELFRESRLIRQNRS